jgi:hypothetical protein
MYIEISNLGEIEIEGFKLLGASTKREEANKIGFFGSGIKYSISYLLRHNLDFRIFSGTEEVKFSIQPTTFRDQTFDKIIVNGTETSITTSWGQNWSRWQIFREIVSNALDEGNFQINLVHEIEGTPGKTKFYVKYSDFDLYYKNLNNFFLLGENNIKGILKKDTPSDLIVYKMGVRVVDECSPENISTRLPVSIFNYNIPTIPLNEERVADRWQIEHLSSRLLLTAEDSDTVLKLYNLISNESNSSVFEYKLLEATSYHTPSDQWLRTIEAQPYNLAPKSAINGIIESRGEKFFKQNKIKGIPDNLYNRFTEAFGAAFTKNIENIKGITGDFVELNITKNQQKVIDKALDLLSKAGVDIAYPIKVVSFFKDSSVVGLAKNETIYLSDKTFDTGLLFVMSTIIEEYIHLKHSVRDETRKFQDVALNLLANVIYNNIQ